MKWPETLTLVRHDTSAYNALKPRKASSPLYTEFVAAYKRNHESDESYRLAVEVMNEFSLKFGDHDTPLAKPEGVQARKMGATLSTRISVPDVIFVSPYKRTKQTLAAMTDGWPKLAEVKTVEDERIREQDHGVSLVYSDWRVMNVMFAEQIALRKKEGEYWYRYPQGENVPDVRLRLRSWIDTLVRDYHGQGVLAVTHHLAILALRANLERWSADDFIRVNRDEKPINAGVTIFRGQPNEGQDGHLVLNPKEYNMKLY